MSLAIMSCRKLINKCSGTKCFEVYNESKDAFDIYKEEKPNLASFFCCAGCKETLFEGEDWEHKIKQMKSKNIHTIHIALCVKVECNNYEKHERLLKKEGFKVVHGTHK